MRKWITEHGDRIGFVAALFFLVWFKRYKFAVPVQPISTSAPEEMVWLLVVAAFVAVSIGFFVLWKMDREAVSLKEILVEDLRHPDSFRRQTAVASLARWRSLDEEIVNALMNVYLCDPDSIVRSAAIDALNRLPGIDLQTRLSSLQIHDRQNQ